jgi:hypothetical protein
MTAKEAIVDGIKTILSLDETVSEIATILAKGYLRYREGRFLSSETTGNASRCFLSR